MDNQSTSLWHPCTQMKDHEVVAPLSVTSASGMYLTLDNGTRVMDVISSWWCKNLGHGHPVLRDALCQQAQQLEHCMLANATHEPIELLSQRLTSLLPHLSRVAYAGDGACAVEMAMKMSIHAHQIQGQTQRQQFVSLQGAYHGETMAALSVSDLGLYSEPYRQLMFDVTHLSDIPYVNSVNDPLWHDASFYWEKTRRKLDLIAEQLTAVVVEPIVQAANHMQIYSADFLRRLASWCEQHQVHLIVDEIMTGFGRTGKWFAHQHANIEPDFVCLGKSMTAGWIAMSAVMTRDSIYQLFYDDYERGKSFMHSHTYAGNPLAAAVALAHLSVIESEQLIPRVSKIEKQLSKAMQDIADSSGKLKNVRHLGMIVAADLMNPHNLNRYGFQVYQEALKQGLLLRPLGDTVYWVLPLNITQDELNDMIDRMQQLFRNLLI